MPAYFVAFVDVTDPEGYKEYVAGVRATVDAHGGRFVARVPGPEVLEGGPGPSRAVIVEFQDMETARRWYHSKEYERLRIIRQRCSRGTVLLIPGYEA